MKGAQRLAAGLEAAERGQAGAGREQTGNANMAREQSPSQATITHHNPAPLVEVWDIDAELREDGTSWRIQAIMAWANGIPGGMSPDVANLETQL